MEKKCYYVILHAYHHFLVEIEDELGPTRLRCSRIVKVNSCRRGWTEFFRDGCRDDTVMMEFPPGDLNNYLAKFDWNHPIPPVKG